MNSNHAYSRRYPAFGFLMAALLLAAGAMGAIAPLIVSAAAAPVISDVTATNVGTSSATINWTTDATSTSQVFYGTTMIYNKASAFDGVPMTSHTATISDLTPSTLYHYAVMSANETAIATSTDNTFMTASEGAASTPSTIGSGQDATASTSTTTESAMASTTTPAATSTAPLAVTSVDVVNSVAMADGLFADGWRWVMHLTVPDSENAFRMKFSDFMTSGSSSTIPVAANVRIFSPQSSNAPDEGSAMTAPSSNVYGGWMYLTGDTAASTAGRQIDVTIEMRIPTDTSAGTYTTTFGAQSVPSAATSTTP